MRKLYLGIICGAALFLGGFFSMAWAGAISVEDYLPVIRYDASYEVFPLRMTALPEFYGLGDYIEMNWELYEPGNTYYPQDLSVSVHVTEDWDPDFTCEPNPGGAFHVIQYHYYYARNDHWFDVSDHEHDWEWIYVVVFDNESCGHIPYAVSLSSHDEDNHLSDVYFYPWVSHGPYIEVEDGTHPVAYLEAGNAFSSTGSGTETLDWEDFLAGYTMEDGSMTFSSCNGDEVVFNETLAYGIDGYFECRIIRTPPWSRIHWEDSFALGQLSTDKLDNTPEPCLPICDDWCCYPGCTWGQLRSCSEQPYHSFGRNPRGRSRPSGIISTSAGNRLFWEDWDEAGVEFAVLRKDVGGSDWDTLSVMTDSTYIDPYLSGGDRIQYKILSREIDASPSRLTPVAAQGVMEVRSLLDLEIPLVQLTQCGDWIFGFSYDGFLHRLTVASDESIQLMSSHDLRDWGLFEGLADVPTHMTSELVYFGHRDEDYWSSYVLLMAIPGRGVAVFLVDQESGQLTFQSVGPPEAYEMAVVEDRVFTAQSDGLGSWKLVEPEHSPVMLVQQQEPFVPVGMYPHCRSVYEGPGYSRITAVFDEPGEEADGVYILGSVFNDGWVPLGSLHGCPPTESCELTPMKWEIEDIDSEQGLMILRDISGHHCYALVDVSNPEYPGYLGTLENDLFSFVSFVGWWNGSTATLLPGGYQLLAGHTFVRYGGSDQLRIWGGLELYKSPLLNDPYGFQYITTIADEGFNALDRLDLMPTDLLSWPGADGSLILVSYYDPFEDTDASGRLVLYGAASDLPSAGLDRRESGPVSLYKNPLQFGQPFPNPTISGVEFPISLSRPADISLRVIDPSGRSVCVLARGRFPSGSRQFHWDARNGSGLRVAPGIYFIAAIVDGRMAGVRRTVLVR
ncbi:MAG: hypothetical protein KJ970_17780 [Candidatus Eisenbacteria bacterium]|uniref:FlgD Ig-like domain-containing protein n=1 Tax=Eiseniibacteriota bacterium TaxID=2212470 RepID=A0A948W8J8_UNCEI|nr:hypothetical protein [Candidatus Eisenbacteria bacterium]MBU1949937.1 hypothetical protein [Candidatus Eisenbacteria bacterium]MBU2692771.1 hypothetical protein [Candidatus Eisenbacteria bacterium]